MHRVGKKCLATRWGSSVLILLALAAAPLGAQSAEAPPFVLELSEILREEGWTAEEVRALVAGARELDWGEAGGADPEVVALALELEREEGEELSGLELAQLALELARTAMEMEALGYGEREVARAALAGVQDLLGEIQAWKDGGKSEPLGPIIRGTLQARLQHTVRQQERIAGQARWRERFGGGDWKGTIPGAPDGWPPVPGARD